jgi:hypothetical protein
LVRQTYGASNEGSIVAMGSVEVSTIEYPHSVIVSDWQSFEELDEALLVIDLLDLACRPGTEEPGDEEQL